MQGVTLLGIYLVVAIIGQAIGFAACTLVERAVPWAGLPVFLACFFGMLVVAWPIAIFLMNRLMPEAAKEAIRPRTL